MPRNTTGPKRWHGPAVVLVLPAEAELKAFLSAQAKLHFRSIAAEVRAMLYEAMKTRKEGADDGK